MNKINEIRLLEVCRERFNYDPLTGLFTYRTNVGYKIKEGAIAGTLCNGYVSIGFTVDGVRKKYSAHRLAFLMTTGSFPTQYVDHINGVTADNRWVNLRQASVLENARNRKIRSDSLTGLKGVDFHKKMGKFRARVWANGKRLELGHFSTAESAYEAYCEKAKDLHGDFFNAG